MNDLGRRVIARSFVSERTVFAAGTSANNKLKSERLLDDPELFEEVVDGLAELSAVHDPDLISYVPNGAVIFAEPVAKRLGLPIAHLFKSPDIDSGRQPGRMFIKRPIDQKAILSAERIVLIEDISRTFHSANKTLTIKQVGQKVVALVSILHRGLAEARNSFPHSSASLDEHYISPELDDDQLAQMVEMASDLRSTSS